MEKDHGKVSPSALRAKRMPRPCRGLIVATLAMSLLSACQADTAGTTAVSASTMPPASTDDDTPEPACFPDFDTFLSAFARDPAVRSAYTLPDIAVTHYIDEDLLGHVERTDTVAKAEYRGFNLHHDATGFHFVDSAGHIDPAPVPLGIAREPDGAYLVSYAHGAPDGRSFRFAKQQDCWYLAAQPHSGRP